MASLGGMLQARGHRVTGSDENVYPPMSTMLEQLGIGLMPGYDAAHLEPAPDCVVVGNAIPRGNSEVEHTLNRRLSYRSLPEVLKEEFIRGRRSLVVAGTVDVHRRDSAHQRWQVRQEDDPGPARRRGLRGHAPQVAR